MRKELDMLIQQNKGSDTQIQEFEDNVVGLEVSHMKTIKTDIRTALGCIRHFNRRSDEKRICSGLKVI